ncbi:MAG: hypothetical protein MK212_03395 [Saprospiraceae bacterium]|nr:hypothetical protein [Saprospiraceae bacterium]
MSIKIHKKLSLDTLDNLKVAEYKAIMKAVVKKIANKFNNSESTVPVYLKTQHTYADNKIGLMLIFGKPDPVWKKEIKVKAKSEKKLTLVGHSFITVDDSGNNILNIMPSAGGALEPKINKAGKKILPMLGLSSVNIVGELSGEATGDTDGDGVVDQGQELDHDKALAEYLGEFKLLVPAIRKFKKARQPKKIRQAIASLRVVLENFDKVYASAKAETQEKYAAAKAQMDKVASTLAGGKKDDSNDDNSDILAKMNKLAKRMKKLKAKIGNLDVLYREAN